MTGRSTDRPGCQGSTRRRPMALALALLAGGCGKVLGQDLPDVVDDRFEMSQVFSTMHVHGSPTQALFSPCSDHVLVIGKGGQIKLYPAADDQYTFEAQPGEDRDSYEILVDLEAVTNSWGDHGLLSAQLHPEFPTEPYIFLFYSVAPDNWSGECMEISNGLPYCEQNAVLERLKIDVTVATDGSCSDWSFEDKSANRIRLMEDWCAPANAHHNAAMEFYTDGSLLVANGDSSQESFDRGYPDLDKCYDPNEPQPQGNFKSQNDAFLQGHLIRINKEAIMYDSPDLPLGKTDYDVWAKGLRNPFRLDVDPVTGDIYIGDVGEITVEEINILRNPLEAAKTALPANFGWPCVEGDGIPLPAFNWLSQSCDTNVDNCGICDSLFQCLAEGGNSEDATCDPAYVPPSFQYDHSGTLTDYNGQEGMCQFIGNSISAIAFFEGRLYAADYSKKCFWFFDVDANGAPDLEKPVIIAEGAGAEIVDLVDGGDGYLYATNFALSKLVRIEPVGLKALDVGASEDDDTSGSSSQSSSTSEAGDDATVAPSTAGDDLVSNDDVNVEKPDLLPPNARLRVLTPEGFCAPLCEVETGEEVRFTAVPSGSYGNTNITEYSISYGDGSDGYTGPEGGGHSHIYKNDGVFMAKLTVTDSNGLSGSENLTIVAGEPFSLVMSPKSGKWAVGDTLKFDLKQAAGSVSPDSITWASSVEHCTTNACTGKTGCHLHSLSEVDTAADDMSGSVIPIAHPLPSQVIITAQMTYDRDVLDYAWPTSAKSHSVTATSSPAGFAVYYSDETCLFTPCIAPFMSNSPASFFVDSIQSAAMKIYEFKRWTVTNADNSTDISRQPSLNNLIVDADDITVTAEYSKLTPKVNDDMAPPVITGIGGYFTKLMVEWTSASDEGVDTIIVFAATPDHDADTYQSSKAVQSSLSTSTQLLVPAGESNYTVYLRSYNSTGNTMSAKSTEYVVMSTASFNPDDLCPDEIPSARAGDSIVPFSDDATAIPGIIQAEDFDAGGEGVAYHDNTTSDEGKTNYRKGEDVDLEKTDSGTINVAWTQPGEWISYTVQRPGSETAVQNVAVRYALVGQSNGFTLALDLEDPDNCADLVRGHDKVIMSNGNLPDTGDYQSWAWTSNASVALEPGPHVVTLCFINNGKVNIDAIRFTDSMCGNGVCEARDGGETCTVCPQDCGECPTPFKRLKLPGDVQAEDFDIGGEGVSFHENDCASASACVSRKKLMSDYRNESRDGEVGLRDADGKTHWGWTTRGEWLTYTVVVSATADYNVTLRYASASAAKANLFLDAYTCDGVKDADNFLGSSFMSASGGETGPFSRTAPFTARMGSGTHILRVCVAKGGFTLDEITFEVVTSGVCNGDGTCDVADNEECDSCEDCVCTGGDAFGGIAADIPGFIDAYRFDEGDNGVAYWDDSEANLGGAGSRDASVDIEVGSDGSFHVGYGVPGEWLKYTVYASKSGTFEVSAQYATLANRTALAVTVDDGTNLPCDQTSDETIMYDMNLPTSGAWDVWTETDPVEVALPAGPHVFKLCIVNDVGAFDTNLKGLAITAAKS